MPGPSYLVGWGPCGGMVGWGRPGLQHSSGEQRSKCSLGTGRDLEAETETEGSRRKREDKRKKRGKQAAWAEGLTPGWKKGQGRA